MTQSVEEAFHPINTTELYSMPSHSRLDSISTGSSKADQTTVLIIEDSPVDAKYLSIIAYQEFGAVIRWIEDGIDGLREALASPPDLVLLDLGLPRLRGEEICRILRSSPAGKNLPIIIVSGMSDTKQRELEMLGLGANAYFSKPINPTELVHAIKSALNTRFIGKQLDDSLFKSPVPEGRRRRERVEPKSLELAADETQEAIQPFGEFGDYSLKGIIGAGGFGTVYRAVQKSLGRNVAIKVLLSEAASDRQLRERFRREAMTMARLNHPNIVQIFDMGEREHTIYIVMELVEGVSLWDAILEEGGDPFPPGSHTPRCRPTMHGGRLHAFAGRGASRHKAAQRTRGKQRSGEARGFWHQPFERRARVDAGASGHRHALLHFPRSRARRSRHATKRHLLTRADVVDHAGGKHRGHPRRDLVGGHGRPCVRRVFRRT
jgi:DNA-binding response OmpR family regulator